MKKMKNYLSLSLLGAALCLSLTACGNNTGSTSGNNDNNAVEDAADDVGNAVEDVADGVGDAVDDLVGNGGFDNYQDAHDYFLDAMGSYHADANFELRDEDQELTDYQEGSMGYHFHLYDTSNNEDGDLFGEFFVDANTGLIYQKDENGNINEYPGTDNSNGNNANSNGTTDSNGTTNNSTSGSNTGNGSTTSSNSSGSGTSTNVTGSNAASSSR
jgi:hypothetical protein